MRAEVFTPVRVGIKEEDSLWAAVGLYTFTAGALSQKGDVCKRAAFGGAPEPAEALP